MEWDIDASMDISHAPSVSGWPVDQESDYSGSPPPRYFQYLADTESTQISLGSHDSFVDTTKQTNNNNNHMTVISVEGQDSAYNLIASNHCNVKKPKTKYKQKAKQNIRNYTKRKRQTRHGPMYICNLKTKTTNHR